MRRHFLYVLAMWFCIQTAPSWALQAEPFEDNFIPELTTVEQTLTQLRLAARLDQRGSNYAIRDQDSEGVKLLVHGINFLFKTFQEQMAELGEQLSDLGDQNEIEVLDRKMQQLLSECIRIRNAIASMKVIYWPIGRGRLQELLFEGHLLECSSS